MSFINILSSVLIWGTVGSTLFTLMLFIVYKTKLALTVANSKKLFLKKITPEILTNLGIAFLFIIGLPSIASIYLISQTATAIPFLQLWLHAYSIFLFINLFDAFVLDKVLVVKWHPLFLKLSDTEYYSSINPYIKGFFKGSLLGLVFSFLSVLISIGWAVI